MVVTFFPATCDTGVEQERIGLPSTCTVQDPQRPAPQPNFVPVSCRVSRKTHSRGVSGGTLTFRSLPLTWNERSSMLVQFQGFSFVRLEHGSQVGRQGKQSACAVPS